MTQGTIAQRLEQAVRHHQRGELAEAERLYREVLDASPGHFDVLHLLGVIHYQKGEDEAAVECIRRAIGIDPHQAAAHSNLGLALHRLGRWDEALAGYDRALELVPDYADALSNRAHLLRDMKRPADALASYEQALALRPDAPATLVSRGDVLLDLGRAGAALASYERALALAPNDAEALIRRGNALFELREFEAAVGAYDTLLRLWQDHAGAWNNRGNALLGLRRPADALASYQRALALRPAYAEALNNRGNALIDLGRALDALASYDQALAVDPDYADAHNHRGNALERLHRYEEALASYERSLARKPGHVAAHFNRGNTLREMGRFTDAVASYDRALALAPDFAEAHNNRGLALSNLGRREEAADDFERALGLAPDLPYAAGMLLHSRMHCCDWAAHDERVARLVADVRAGKRSAAPMTLLAVEDSADTQLRCARTWVSDRYPPAPQPLWQGARYRHHRIHLAYLSSDFRNHAVGHLMGELLERHDRRRFEVTALSFGPDDGSAARSRLTAAAERFIDVARIDDAEVGALVRDLEIDVAVDLNAFTALARTGVFALRPAPLQVSFLGYAGTTGAPYFDYLLADSTVIPEEARAHYAEQVVRLPGTFHPSGIQRFAAAPAPGRAQAGLPERGFVFCAFNNSYKITPAVFDVWMRLLRRVPGSVLWMQASNEAVPRNLQREAAERGIAPERLVFARRVDRMEDHLARYGAADLFLDTFPYGAHTTAGDALGAGLPVLTCMGGGMASRVGGSLLGALGVPELITRSFGDYEALAVQLACEPARLAPLRDRLRQSRGDGGSFDADRYVRHIESAYVAMFERFQRGEPPAGFAVASIAG